MLADKMVWTKWYTDKMVLDKMVLDKMVWIIWHRQNDTDKTVAIFGIDYNLCEFNIYLVAKVTNKL